VKLILCATACAVVWSWSTSPGQAETAAAVRPVVIVAAENFYGDVARQIGGPEVAVTSIMSAPQQDPHQFEPGPAAARALAAADIVIYNGADYDPWMEALLAGSPGTHRDTIVVAPLMHKRAGDNPHLWYDPATMRTVAERIAAALESRDASHKDAYEQRLKAFLDSLAALSARIDAIRGKHAGTPVTATEPIFGYMGKALGFDMRNERFQLSVMNDTEPSASDLAAIRDDLKNRRVKILFYNSQVSDELTQQLRGLAKEAKVAVVGVSETEPAGTSYQAWIAAELDAVQKALDGGGS
jgi:zinc/manganese transport system substrate-binding protein